MGYRISELARVSGFSPSTLRYYETAGLLPDPDRTGAGYRVYGEEAVERLAFIARAKTMRFSLSDIAELVALWADGPCGPVQDRLRDLLDAKVTEVGSHLAAMSGFAAQLGHLRTSLATARPAERCGPGCGCDTALPAPAGPGAAQEGSAAPVVCTLSIPDAADRGSEWADLLTHVSERHKAQDGLRLRLPSDPVVVARAADLAVRETQCCAFFSFTLTVDVQGTWLAVTAPPDGQVILAAVFGDPA
ncbi:MAG TPA: MerR family transcriptional regulator [Streptosporangiaceae bacterium]|nr:MerR family transcriptional regulator [Streptosporangiaceae bacterium]